MAPLVRKKVLVVEDDPSTRFLVMVLLEEHDCTVLEACDGPEALHMVRTERPDLVLLDVRLPGLDGLAVCRLIKANPAVAAVPVVLLTVKSTPEDRAAGLAAGADGYLTKPMPLLELLTVVDQWLLQPAQTAEPA